MRRVERESIERLTRPPAKELLWTSGQRPLRNILDLLKERLLPWPMVPLGFSRGTVSTVGIDDKFTHVSTAGGAMLCLLSGQNLPGVEALSRAAARMRTSNFHK